MIPSLEWFNRPLEAPQAFYTGIGSRETPKDICALQRRLAFILGTCGYALQSGGCPEGSDFAFLQGALRAKRFHQRHLRIYLSWNGMAGLYHDPEKGLLDAGTFSTHAQARQIAEQLHPAWERCGRGAKAHHTRNVFQILSDTLANPTAFVLCYAPPQGSQGHVKGGTATAVKLALERGVPVYNLYHADVLDRCTKLVRGWGL